MSWATLLQERVEKEESGSCTSEPVPVVPAVTLELPARLADIVLGQVSYLGKENMPYCIFLLLS